MDKIEVNGFVYGAQVSDSSICLRASLNVAVGDHCDSRKDTDNYNDDQQLNDGKSACAFLHGLTIARQSEQADWVEFELPVF